MPPVKILVTAALPRPLLAELKTLPLNVDVTVLDAPERATLRPGLAADPSPEAAHVREQLAASEVVFFGFEAPADLIELASQVRWMHTTAAGVDSLLARGFGLNGYPITCGSGPHAISLSEFILMQILMLVKRAYRYQRQQVEGKWARIAASDGISNFELNGKTVGIIGLGDIGLATAERVRAMGCHVIASKRSVSTRQANVGPVAELLPPSDLPYLLQQSDFVVLSVPLTPETRHLINADTLALMKRSAYLINIARGPVIDEPALIDALRDGTIAGAALDVFDREPLPPDSPFWGMEQVIVTPHTSASSEHFQRRQLELFKDNLNRYLAGQPLLNVVDPERGY